LENLENLDNSQSNFQKLNLEKLPEKFPETLEEQRDYYLNLYQKWAKWQKENPEKLPIGFRTKEEFDFDKLLQTKSENFIVGSDVIPKKALTDFVNLVQNDQFLDFLYFGDFCFRNIVINKFSISNFSISNIQLFKKIIINNRLKLKTEVEFEEVSGELNIKNEGGDINLIFSSCSFSHITLENFDLRYFSVETIEYLHKMKKENKLTLINCKEWELPTLRESLEIEEMGKKIWEKNLPISENLQSIKSTLHQYLAWFNDFVEKTEDKIIQLRITNNKKSMLIEVYSFNGATSNLIEKKFIEFLKISGEEDWQIAKNYITSHGQKIQDPFVEYAIASQKQTMDFVIKSKELENKREGQLFKFIKDFTATNNSNLHLNIANNNQPSMPINFTQNNNIQTLNGNIDTKITEINNNSSNLELKNILQEITKLKTEIINNEEIKNEEKEDALSDIQVLTENIEKKDDPQAKISIRKSLKSLGGNIALNLVASGLFEVIKKYFGF